MRERVKWDSTHNPVGLVDMVHAGWVQRLLLAADWSGFPGPEPDLVKNGQTRVGAQAKKIFEKLVDLGIEYVHEPPDSVPGAQWIRPVTEVLAFRQATCVDLCVTFCCAALDAGIYPLIVTLTTANGKQRHSIVVVPLGRTWSTGCDAVIESGFSREPLAVDGCALARVVAEYADDPTGTWLAIDVQQAMMPNGDWGTALSRGADYLQEWKWDVCVDVGGQRSHKADDAVPPGGNLERILAPARTPLPQDFTPLQLIKARHAVVSFEERSEYRKLRQWATTPARTSTDTANGAGADIAVAVVTGKGGSGKTRMAVELCGDLSSTGWYTGFLRTTTDVTDQELAALEDLATELMVVVDYAEEAQRGRLAEVFRALLVRRAPTRIVLTARGADAWWDEFREEVEQDGLELSNTLVVSNLGKARQEEDQGLLNRICIRAVRGFSARLYHSIPRSVRLPEDLGDTALDVVLRAWLAVCDEQADTGEEIPTRSDLYDKVLEIEFSQWKKAPVLTKISTNHMRRAAATLSLLAPNQDEDEIDEVLNRLPEWEHEHLRRSRFAELLVHTLLHGDSGDTVSVRPDPVAEYLVLKVFGKKPDLLDQVLPSDPLEVPGIEDPDSDESVVQRALLLGQQSQNVCVALTRAAPLDPTRARRLAGLALRARPYLWGCALDVALIQGGPFAHALEDVIASGADLPLAEIENAIPLGHGALRGVALAATKRLADFAERNPEQQARWANSLSVRLSAVGDREGALGAAREAVGLYRALAKEFPAAHTPNLAGSLNNLAGFLSAVGDRDEALEAAREAVGVYRGLAEAAPRAYMPDLAMSLNTLAIRLSDVGERCKALGAAKEAVGLYRALAEAAPAAYRPDLAGSLNNLASFLSDVGDREGALGAAREAVDLYRALAKEFPAAHTPDLAISLNNLASFLSAVGDREGALGAVREAVRLRRGLAVKYPAPHTPDLAASLRTLAALLSETGQREEALAVFIEDFDRFPPATRAYLLLARAAWRNNNEDEDLTAAAHEADAADAPAFLGPVRRMIAHAIADSGKELEGLPPWATVTVDPTMRSRLNAWLNCSDRSEQADLVETTWSSPSDSERAALSAAAELYVDVPLLRELAALVDRVAKDGLEAVVTRLRCLHRSLVLAADWYNAHMNGRGAQYLHEHMVKGSDAPQRDGGSGEGSREEPKEWEKGLYDPSVRAEVLQVLASGLPEAPAHEMRSVLALAELSDPGTAYAAHTSDEGAEDALKEFLEARN